jgi:hypothetical protein
MRFHRKHEHLPVSQRFDRSHDFAKALFVDDDYGVNAPLHGFAD